MAIHTVDGRIIAGAHRGRDADRGCLLEDHLDRGGLLLVVPGRYTCSVGRGKWA